MTLMEYLQDYASPETKKVGLELIQNELENIPSEKVKRLTEEHLADIVNGQRDFETVIQCRATSQTRMILFV